MPSKHRIVWIYQELADWYGRQGQAQLRDRFLMLAADAAFSAGKKDEAERLRLRLLQLNPHHLLKPFATFAEAVQSGDVQDYLLDLRQNYPQAVAEQLLKSLDDAGNEAGQKTKVPPTVAVLDLGPAPADQAENASEPLKVYRVLETEEEPGASAPPEPPRKPAVPPVVPKRRPQPAPPASAAAVPAPPPRPRKSYPPPSDPEPPPARTPDADESVTAVGVWISTGLFVLVLAAGLALAVYTLLGPFLRAK